MTITLAGTVPVTIICNYTPTAKATFEEKIEHYTLLKKNKQNTRAKDQHIH